MPTPPLSSNPPSGPAAVPPATGAGPPDARTRRRVLGASVIGTSVEWYDYQVYSLASALVIGKLFFPSLSTLGGTLAAFATFGVGFVARPLGGVLAGRSVTQLGTPAGMLLANVVVLAVVAVLPDGAFEVWGWRVPLLLSAVMILVGFYLRRRVEETPAFAAMSAAGTHARHPLRAVLRTHRRPLLLATATFLGNNAVGYLFLAYLLSYATSVLGLPQGEVLSVMLVGMALWLVATPLFGQLSDRVGRKPVYLAGYALTIAWALPFWLLVDTGSTGAMLAAVILLVIAQAATYGPQAAMFAELFPARVRYSGASLAAVLGGGIAPFVAGSLYGATGSTLSVAAYMIGICLVSLLAVLALRVPPAGSPLDTDHIADEHPRRNR